MKIKKIPSYGNNTNKTPFPIGSKLRLKDGTEEWQLVGYKGDLMLMKPINEASMWGKDSLAPHIIENRKKISNAPMYNPDIAVQQHVMYADMYDVIS